MTYTKKDVIEWELRCITQADNSCKLQLVKKNTLNIGDKLGMRQGWGIAYRKHNDRLYATDGTSTMKEIDPATWTSTRNIELKSAITQARVTRINELEALPQQNGRYLIGN